MYRDFNLFDRERNDCILKWARVFLVFVVVSVFFICLVSIIKVIMASTDSAATPEGDKLSLVYEEKNSFVVDALDCRMLELYDIVLDIGDELGNPFPVSWEDFCRIFHNAPKSNVSGLYKKIANRAMYDGSLKDFVSDFFLKRTADNRLDLILENRFSESPLNIVENLKSEEPLRGRKRELYDILRRTIWSEKEPSHMAFPAFCDWIEEDNSRRELYQELVSNVGYTGSWDDFVVDFLGPRIIGNRMNILLDKRFYGSSLRSDSYLRSKSELYDEMGSRGMRYNRTGNLFDIILEVGRQKGVASNLSFSDFLGLIQRDAGRRDVYNTLREEAGYSGTYVEFENDFFSTKMPSNTIECLLATRFSQEFTMNAYNVSSQHEGKETKKIEVVKIAFVITLLFVIFCMFALMTAPLVSLNPLTRAIISVMVMFAGIAGYCYLSQAVELSTLQSAANSNDLMFLFSLTQIVWVIYILCLLITLLFRKTGKQH